MGLVVNLLLELEATEMNQSFNKALYLLDRGEYERGKYHE